MTTDDVQLPELTRRQEAILALIVRAYSESPEPVSSKSLVEKLDVSSATIRNDMQVLEQLGYVAAPHTSAGRVPTQDGYRYFVRQLLNIVDLDEAEQLLINQKLLSLPLATEQWMRQTATLLARTAQTGALVTPPMAEASRYKHVELISVQGRLVLMVMVLQGGAVHQQMLTLAEPVTQTRLSEVAVLINGLCYDLDADKVRIKGLQTGMLEREIVELIADLMERADKNQLVAVYRDGLSEMLGAFQQNTEGAQQALRVFEERAFLNLILKDLLAPQPNEVKIIIAGNGRWEELSHLTMIISRYGLRGQVSGAIGVLGPTHINYGRAVSTVRYISSVMTDMLADVFDEETPALKSNNEAEDET
ncbi:MAG: heat-inducible transcription repressor HrcA [Anaerolineae bacterium]|nr:heat-inducible transcription repressor HrcA [Anaerolineae bacterium]MCA9908525.1 heat-inducible transcription repressor HrcA [Anaerolineae bacterium]